LINKLKVLIISSKYSPEYSGSGLRAHNTYLRLRKKFEIDFDVITSSITFNKYLRYEIDNVIVRRIAGKLLFPALMKHSGSKLINFVEKIFEFIKCKLSIDFYLEGLPALWFLFRNRKKYDLIHIFGTNNVTGAAIFYAKICKKPIIIEFVNLTENPHHPLPRWMSFIWKQRFPDQAKFICISKRLSDVLIRHGYSSEQIWCRPNPVNTDKFNLNYDNKNDLRQKLTGFNKDIILILHLAKFMPIKNQIFIVDVLSHLPENYHCAFVGPLVDSGPLRERDYNYYTELLARVNQLDLSKRVYIKTCFVENPEQFMQASDVVVVPSTTEACGTPALEAVACGVPVVVNNIPGVFDQWIHEGKSGYIYDLDPKKWADMIINAVSIKREELIKARNLVIETCSVLKEDEIYKNIILDAVNNKV
jgi:glycosyltransferase involved in cell wall biosynthesis